LSLILGNTKSKIGLILLAAGTSRRLGEPKQLLEFGGKTLLRRSAEAAKNSRSDAIVVVFGSNSERFEGELEGLDLEIVCNENWIDGMGSSIRAGLNRLLEIEPALTAVIVMVCDQPFVSSELVDKLIAKFLEEKASIVASKYAETFGVPALFEKELFRELMDLRGTKGAKTLIVIFQGLAEFVDFPKGNVDIDTAEDYSKLLQAGFLG
jgi:molybdenum cofactor cytidylyltransferase